MQGESMGGFKRKWQWCPHEKHVWVPGCIVEEKKSDFVIHTNDGESIPILDMKKLQVRSRKTANIPNGQVRMFRTDTQNVKPFRYDRTEGKWKETAPLQDIVHETLRPGFYSNLGDMEDMSEAPCNYQLRERYKVDNIYTLMGNILVAINPYKLLPIYSSYHISQYSQEGTDNQTKPPHIFGTSARAYEGMKIARKNQAVIISGESGSGKTESTKLILQFLGEMSRQASTMGSVEDSSHISSVEQEVLLSNPILEAFGNAKTLANDNSSRFGKWMEVIFSPKGVIHSAKIQVYLLERSRVVTQIEGESNYHIFDLLIGGAPREWRERLCLKSDVYYNYTKSRVVYRSSSPSEQKGGGSANGDEKDGKMTVISTKMSWPSSPRQKRQNGKHSTEKSQTNTDQENQRSQLKALVRRMRQLHFSSADVNHILELVAGVLHLGNLSFRAQGQFTGQAVAEDPGQLAIVCKLLGLNAGAFQSALCHKSISVGGKSTLSPLPIPDIGRARDATAKFVYGKVFHYLVNKINQKLMRGKGTSIGVLDIFGFEVFEKNSFEQFCINYANEKLQYLFNQHVFEAELAEYRDQRIDISEVKFTDNIGCVNLIERKDGIISLIADVGANKVSSNAENLITKMHQKFAGRKDGFYTHVRKRPNTFVIRHYAGSVMYEIDEFLPKDNDYFPELILQCLRQTENQLLKDVVCSKIQPDATTNRPQTPVVMSRSKSPSISNAGSKAKFMRQASFHRKPHLPRKSSLSMKKKMTIAIQFRRHLETLMSKLRAAQPHYVRCLKPNLEKRPNVYDSYTVLRQVKYAGLLGAIRLRKLGFPFRQGHGEFIFQYSACILQNQRKSIAYSKAGTEGEATPEGYNQIILQVINGRKAAGKKLRTVKEEKHSRNGGDEDGGDGHDDEETLKKGAVVLMKALWPSALAVDPSLVESQYAIGRTKVYMKLQVRKALTEVWNVAMRATVVRIQATVRMYLTRKRYRTMLPLYKRAIFAQKGRDLKEITRSLGELDASDIPEVNPRFVAELRTLHDFLEAQGRVLILIRNACKVKDLQLLKTAVEQTNGLRRRFPGQGHSQQLSKSTAEAIVLVSELEEFALVKDLVKTAVLNEDVKELDYALRKADENPYMQGTAELAEAHAMMAKMRKEEAMIKDFVRCFEESRDKMRDGKQGLTLAEISELETFTDKSKGLQYFSNKAPTNPAKHVMKEAMKRLVIGAQIRRDKKALEEVLIPKAGSMGFVRIETSGLEWLERERKAEEAKRMERERKEREEKERVARLKREEERKKREEAAERKRREAEAEKRRKEEAEAQQQRALQLMSKEQEEVDRMREEQEELAVEISQQAEIQPPPPPNEPEDDEPPAPVGASEPNDPEVQPRPPPPQEAPQGDADQKADPSDPAEKALGRQGTDTSRSTSSAENSSSPDPSTASPADTPAEAQTSEPAATRVGLDLYPAGTMVTLVGLNKNPEFNDKVAIIADFDLQHKRFLVRLQAPLDAEGGGGSETAQPENRDDDGSQESIDGMGDEDDDEEMLLGVRDVNIRALDARRQRIMERKKELEKQKIQNSSADTPASAVKSLPDELCKQLNKAAGEKDYRALQELFSMPEIQAHSKTDKIVRVALKVLRALETEHELERRLRKAIEGVKTTHIKLLLKQVSDLGLQAQDRLKPLVEHGTNIA